MLTSKKSTAAIWVKSGCLMGFILAAALGCTSQNPKVHNRVEVTYDDGMGSLDVIGVANQACSALLNSDIVIKSPKPLTIAVAPIRKTMALRFDSNLFLRRLRLELNKQANGRLQFVAQGQSQNAIREEIRDDANSERIQKLLDVTAKELVALPELKNGAVLALLPATQVNFVNLNAESYLAFLRTKVVLESGRKCKFLMPGALHNADYYLSGMFVADSDKTEGMINLADYIRDLENAEREGKSLFEVAKTHEYNEREKATDTSMHYNASGARFVLRPRLPLHAAWSKQLHQKPRVAKFLNVMLVDTKNKCSVYERQLNIESFSTGFGASDYILSAEVSDINKVIDGTRYYLITLQLVEPIKNVIVWETGYEAKFTKE